MTPISTKRKRPAIGWLKCLFGFHDYCTIARTSDETMHVGCTACDREWGMHNTLGVIVPWRAVEGFYVARGYRRGEPMRTGDWDTHK